MNKGELVGKMAQSAGITKAAAEKALAGVVEAVGQALQSGDKVSVAGFGTFSITERKAREGRNPATGKKIRIPAKKVVKFKPAAKLANDVQK
jgi:DNA-binding protein HU-beta